jgi:HlyD family secretion protein
MNKVQLTSFFKKVSRHKIISTLIIGGIGFGGYYAYSQWTTEPEVVRYVLAAATRGNVVSSITGSGQVTTQNQVSLGPKASGVVTSVAVVNGQAVTAGQVLLQLDVADASRTVRNAQTNLETARLELEELRLPAEQYELTQAQNSVTSAQRSLEKAKDDQKQVTRDAEDTIDEAFTDGYNTMSSAYLSMPDHIGQLEDVLSSEEYTYNHVGDYEVLLGENSSFITTTIRNYEAARELFDTNFIKFQALSRTDSSEAMYAGIADTLATAGAISRALESSRNMLDAIAVKNYQKLNIAATIDALRPQIISNISKINQIISDLQGIKRTIDDTTTMQPINVKNAAYAVTAAEEQLAERTLALQRLIDGSTALEIRSAENAVRQQQDTLSAAQQEYADHTLRSPFDGIVSTVSAQRGQSVSASSGAIELIATQRMAEISLNEIDVARVSVGQKATLTFDAIADTTLTGTVAEIDSVGTTSQGVVTYGVKITFDTQDDRVRPGMSVSAAIITQIKSDVVMVPVSAVKTGAGGSIVQVVTGMTASQVSGSSQGVVVTQGLEARVVVVGVSNDESVEITQGLTEGEVVVIRTIQPTAVTAAATTPGQGQQGLFGASSAGAARIR